MEDHPTPPHFVLSAGETSGDHLAGAIAEKMLEYDPALRLAGVAGPHMRSAGVEPWYRTDELSIMGLSEVLRHLPRVYRLRRDLGQRVLAARPRAFIGVDAPDFNLGLARQLKRNGVFTAQVVSPSVWAWRAGRIPKIARSLDLLLTLFPFEPDLYRATGLDARFIGHPLADEFENVTPAPEIRARLGLDPDKPTVTLLPGSRPGELRRHGRLVLETAHELNRREGGLQLLLALAEDHHLEHLPAADEWASAGVSIVTGRTRDAIIAADAALAASGTVTLECLLAGTPMVVFYRLASATYHMARMLNLVRSEHVSLPNILAGRKLVPERIQHEAKAETLADDVLAWLDDTAARNEFMETADTIRSQLAQGAAARAAEVILEK